MILFLCSKELELEREMEKQDDHVAQAVHEMRKLPVDRTRLPALTDQTFFPETNDRPMLMVLFYLSCKLISNLNLV